MIGSRISWSLTHRQKRKLSLWVGLLLIVLLIVSSNWFWRLLYPIYYEESIRTEAAAYGIDPLMVAAVIRVESKFKEENVSHVGAIGLMQLMPDTAQWIAKESGIPYNGTEDLSNPQTNIQMGVWYLSFLNKEFKGNWVAAVAAYNAGQGRVNRWLHKDYVWDGQLDTADQIPVGETRHYVQRVFYSYDKYKELYTVQ